MKGILAAEEFGSVEAKSAGIVLHRGSETNGPCVFLLICPEFPELEKTWLKLF